MKKIKFLALILFFISFGHSTFAKERLHIITMSNGGTDAIILESDDKFAMIDTGEDSSFPDGSDNRFPKRFGISEKNYSIEDRLFKYIEKLGIKKFEFVIVTHTHSDHIGNAPKLLQKIPTKKLYLKKYSDERITDKDRLWDNLFGYEKTLDSAKANNVEVIQDIKEEDAKIKFGNMNLQLYNYENEYDENGKLKKVYDDNLNSILTVVNYDKLRLFFGGDLENTDGREDLYGPIIGKVDLMKFNHHFDTEKSNSINFIKNLSPKIMVKTNVNKLDDKFLKFMKESNIQLINAGRSDIESLVFELDKEKGILDKTENYVDYGFYRENGILKFKNWEGKFMDGIFFHLDQRYKFNKDGSVSTGWINNMFFADSDGKFITNNWKLIDNKWYYFNNYGEKHTGWIKTGNKWYYLDKSGIMQSSKWIGDYYLGKDGAMLVNTITPDGYYVDDNGKYYEVFEWFTVNNKWKLKLNGNTLKNAWAKYNYGWFYFGNDEIMVTNWKKINGDWYFFGNDGEMKFELWQGDYYLGTDGKMLTNATTPDGFKVDENGKKIVPNSWVKKDNHWRYLDENLFFVRDEFIEYKENTYYLNVRGNMVTGWSEIDKEWYYFNTSGAMIKDKWVGNYYLGKDGKMLKNTTTPDGFKVDENGKKQG